jgi:hypothetical protein
MHRCNVHPSLGSRFRDRDETKSLFGNNTSFRNKCSSRTGRRERYYGVFDPYCIPLVKRVQLGFPLLLRDGSVNRRHSAFPFPTHRTAPGSTCHLACKASNWLAPCATPGPLTAAQEIFQNPPKAFMRKTAPPTWDRCHFSHSLTHQSNLPKGRMGV